MPNSCLILIESFDDDLLPESPDPLLLTLPQAVTKTNANNNATIPANLKAFHEFHSSICMVYNT